MAGPARFYHIIHIPTQIRQPNELDQFEAQFTQMFLNREANSEHNFIDLGRIISNLKDTQRSALFTICREFIGNVFRLKSLEQDNELSMKYIDMDGQNVSVGSTGTRLLMTLIGLCMDERFGTILIDEPELGLSPKVQSALSTSFQIRQIERSTFRI